ncbi:MAG: adenosylcobinamide-GDP ribazoletransferase [Thermoprotei archaeon]|nr:MAG: adenosylcobinamide-GDP ribazoletransferase [Thermoprotei archaeon]
MSILRMLKNTLAFLTIIPVGMDEHIFNDAARLMWTFPLYGAFIGLISGSLGLGLSFIRLPPLAVAVVMYVALLGITGFNHMDGLLDFADAIATPTSKERRLQIMKDQYTGAAAVTTGLVVAVATIAFLSSIPPSLMIQAIVTCEASAKLGMVISAFLGPAARKGLGEIFINKFREKHRSAKLVASIVLCLALSLTLGVIGMITCLAGALTGIIVTGIARRGFGGITGDVMGAINEISRATSLAACVVGLNWGLQAWLWLGVGV